MFSFQLKIKGKIAKFAYFYEVTESGYEIVSPDEVLVHSSTDGTRKWFVAVSRQSGTTYGLFGFEKAAEGFGTTPAFTGAVLWGPVTELL